MMERVCRMAGTFFDMDTESLYNKENDFLDKI